MSSNSEWKDVKAQKTTVKLRHAHKIQFGVVVVECKQEHSHSSLYGCIDYEEYFAVFDLSNRTDGESVSDYPLWRDWCYCRGQH